MRSMSTVFQKEVVPSRRAEESQTLAQVEIRSRKHPTNTGGPGR